MNEFVKINKEKLFGGSAILAALLTYLTRYFINNARQCCDQLYAAGWPLPVYGGSGGVMGIRNDHITYSSLLIDLCFWFVVSFMGVYFVLRYIIKSKKKN